jgi:hypothetical protein
MQQSDDDMPFAGDLVYRVGYGYDRAVYHPDEPLIIAVVDWNATSTYYAVYTDGERDFEYSMRAGWYVFADEVPAFNWRKCAFDIVDSFDEAMEVIAELQTNEGK